MNELFRQLVFSFLLLAIAGSLRGEEKQAEIKAILIHPPFSQSYNCSEHWDGQFQYPGDALGADCTIAKLVEEDGRKWMRPYRGDGRKNEDWFGWGAAVLAPCDCRVINVHICR